MAGGTKITVKQILGKGSPTVVSKVGRIVTNAQGWLNQALPEIKSNMSPGTSAAFSRCFCKAPDPASVNTVKSVLSTIASNIKQPTAVKVRQDDSAYGYVKSYYGGRRHLVNGMAFHDEDGDRVHRLGDIHLDRDTINNDMTMAVITFIHEATHRFANTDDHDDRGYFKSDGSDFCAPGLTQPITHNFIPSSRNAPRPAAPRHNS